MKSATAQALVVYALAGLAHAQAFVVEGSCRDGQPHGAYELKMSTGQLRVAGAFVNGKRTGSFLYWTAAGERIAHLPFDDNAMNGTVALWFPDKGNSKPKVEAAYAAGRLHGMKRSWHPNGRVRAELRYEAGLLLDARAFDVAGKPLPLQEARALAERDAVADASGYATLDRMVRDNLPCKAASVGDGKTNTPAERETRS